MRCARPRANRRMMRSVSSCLVAAAVLTLSSSAIAHAQTLQRAGELGEAADRKYDTAGLAACLEAAADHASWGGLEEALGSRTLQLALRSAWRVVPTDASAGRSERENVVLVLEPSAVISWTFAIRFEHTDRGVHMASSCELLLGPTERIRPARGRPDVWRRESVSYSESCRWRESQLVVEDGRLHVVDVSDRIFGPPGDCRLQH